ncbi:MAG: glutamate racemase [Anaerolineales bacterium]|nr:glutamate racemase [Anaerolineales bacterium]
MSTKQPIGLFDSGVGGLSILKEIHTLLPAEDMLYFADQAHVPYGSRSLEDVRMFSEEITRFLLAHGAKIIVLACNTASAASLHYLRAVFPDVRFIGMEPAIKPAAQRTKSGIVGVLATPATFQGELFASVVDRFADGVQVLQSTLPGLVERVEKGDVDSPQVEQILNRGLEPLIERGADTLVLGCTHFPFVLPMIEALSGERIEVIDPSPAIARRTQQVLREEQVRSSIEETGKIRYLTSGDLEPFKRTLERLAMPAGDVDQAIWKDLHLAPVAGGSQG